MSSAMVFLFRYPSKHRHKNFSRFSHPQSGGLEFLHIGMASWSQQGGNTKTENRHMPIGLIRPTSDKQKFHTSSSKCSKSDRLNQFGMGYIKRRENINLTQKLKSTSGTLKADKASQVRHFSWLFRLSRYKDLHTCRKKTRS